MILHRLITMLISLCLVPTLFGCADGNGIGVVQNGIGVVQNGFGPVDNSIGKLPAEALGTIAYDVVAGVLQIQNSNPSSSLVKGPKSGEVSVKLTSSGPTSKRAWEFVFKDFQLKDGYPLIKAGKWAAEFDTSGDTTTGEINTNGFTIKEQNLSMKLKYNLKNSSQGLGGKMTGTVSVNDTQYPVDNDYATPILLAMEFNQSEFELGQKLMFRMLALSHSAIEQLKIELNSPQGRLNSIENSLKTTPFTAVSSGLWQALGNFTFETSNTAGDYQIANIGVVNKANLSSDALSSGRWPAIGYSVLPAGSGVKAKDLKPIDYGFSQTHSSAPEAFAVGIEILSARAYRTYESSPSSSSSRTFLLELEIASRSPTPTSVSFVVKQAPSSSYSSSYDRTEGKSVQINRATLSSASTNSRGNKVVYAKMELESGFYPNEVDEIVAFESSRALRSQAIEDIGVTSTHTLPY